METQVEQGREQYVSTQGLMETLSISRSSVSRYPRAYARGT